MARLSTTTRFSLFYLLHYAAMGIHLPGMQLWYQSQGVTPTQLGALGFVTILARVLTGPLFGSWVDRNGHARTVCVALNWLTLCVFALNLLGGGYWTLLAIAIAYTSLRSPSGPLGDALAVAAGRREPVDFGRVRFWALFWMRPHIGHVAGGGGGGRPAPERASEPTSGSGSVVPSFRRCCGRWATAPACTR